MKSILLSAVLFVTLGAKSQVFSFQDTSTVLVKTTDESPAHWYIEIFNDALIDTTLRWKASFGPNVPPEWVITFDDQDNFYNPVNDGDSADFVLSAMPLVPQKLIIGAILNNTPATASVYFDIYDPSDPSYVQTIEYRFIISMGSGTWGIEENNQDNWFVQNGDLISFTHDVISEKVTIYDASGKQVYSLTLHQNQFTLPEELKSGIYFLTIETTKKPYASRIMIY